MSIWYVSIEYTGQFRKKVTLSHVYNEVTTEPTIMRYTTVVRKTQNLFVIDMVKCFRPLPPGETMLKNGDSTAKGVLNTEFWIQNAFCCGVAILQQSPLAAVA
jgi:hypothetical protein